MALIAAQAEHPAERAGAEIAGRGYDWRTARLFMLRVAGLPFARVADLSFPDTLVWTDAVRAAEAELSAARQEVADALQEAIGRLDDDAVRRRLINLRRDVFNLRPIRDAAAADLAAGLLDPPAADRLRGFVAGHARWVRLLAEGNAVFEAELASRRARLRDAGREPDLRHGLMLSSASLDQYADGYLAGPPAGLGKRARRIERSLLEYLFRTACKTSPFSTLTSVAVGEFGAGSGALVSVDGMTSSKRSATRLNMAVLARVSDAIIADVERRADLPVRAAAGWTRNADLVRYLRRSRPPGSGGEDSGAKVDPLRETLFFLPAGTVLADILRIAAQDPPVSVRRLEAELSAVAGREAADVERYVGHLLRLGLLTLPDLRIDIHDPDPLASYRDRVAALGRPWADALAARLTRVGAAVDAFGRADLPRRRALHAEVRAEVVAALVDLGREEPAVPGALIYEDTALCARSVRADAARWEADLLPDLRELSRIMPAFDDSVLRRLVTRGYFRIRHGEGGRCEDFLAFAHEFQRDFFDNFSQRLMRHRSFDPDGAYVPHDNWLRQPELSGVDGARAAAATLMAQAYAKMPPGATECVLGPDFVDRVAGELPADLGALQPRSFFLQIADDGAHPPMAVVNRVYSGLTLLFSRFAHLFGGDRAPGEAGGSDGVGDLAQGLREVLRGVAPPGAVFAELTGGYDTTNLNLHPEVTAYEIVCPGETSARPDDEQIPVDDLVVEEDLSRDRLVLRSKRLGLEVIPVYLGFLLPGALPEVQQVLLNFSYTGMARLDLWSGTPIPSPSRESGPVMTPRIRYGQVILSRQQWKVLADEAPRQRTGQTDSDWFLAWQRWRHAHGLPNRVFLTTERRPAPAADPDGIPAAPAAAASRPEYKPLYVDFDSYFCLLLADAVIRSDPGVLVFTEMLPGPDELWLRDGDERYVTELTVEIDGVRRETA